MSGYPDPAYAVSALAVPTADDVLAREQAKCLREAYDRIENFREAISFLLTGLFWGYLPNGSDIKYVTGGGSKPPFREHLEYLDRQITLVGTGGLLTMLSESGSGTLAGGAHQESFLQVARGDAVALSEVIQRDVDAPLLAEAFPGWPVHAYFEFAPVVSDQASRVVQDAVQLAAAGVQMEPEEVSEKTGYRVQGMPAGV